MTPENLKKYAEEIANTNGYDWDEEIVMLAVDYLSLLDKLIPYKYGATRAYRLTIAYNELLTEVEELRIIKHKWDALDDTAI